MSEQNLATKYGVPMAIVINNENRHPGCIAAEAIIASVEGEYVTYQGVCPQGHRYTQRMTLNEARQRAALNLAGGEISLGSGSSYTADKLEEY